MIKIPHNPSGINRKDMPQIKSPAFFAKFLERSDVLVLMHILDPTQLNPIQSNFNRSKIKAIMDSGKDLKPIIVSNDWFVIDGNHRWLAALNMNKRIECWVINKSNEELLKIAKNYAEGLTEALELKRYK